LKTQADFDHLLRFSADSEGSKSDPDHVQDPNEDEEDESNDAFGNEGGLVEDYRIHDEC